MSETAKRIGVGGAWLTGPALWAMARARTAQWDLRARAPAQVQTETLLRHCQMAKDTAFGRAHDLGRVRSHADFVERVPLRGYDDFDPWLARMRRGERDVLWPGLVRHFAKSAGSSQREGDFKYLPLSDMQVRLQGRQAFDVLARYLTASGDRSFTGGFALGLLPPPTVTWDGPVGTTNNPGYTQSRMPAIGGEISITHEKTTQRNIEDAVQRVASRQRCAIVELAAAGEVRELDAARGGKAVGRYLLFVEFASAPSDLDVFAQEVDAEIGVENYTYALHRSNDLALLPLQVIPLRQGTMARFAEAVRRRGWQQKFPRILDDAQRDLLRGLAEHGR